MQGKEEPFQLDHAALLSILRDEGVAALRGGSATPESTKPYNYLPQRVSVMKSHQKAGPSTGPMRVTQFSLDPAAMQSTQHGEGVKAGGTLEKTPSNSAHPTDRDNPIYTARRVPVTKPQGVTPGKVAVPHEGTPNMKWTPQRVPNTRNQPMTAMASLHGGSDGGRGDHRRAEAEQEEEEEEEEEKRGGAQPFLQEPHRESVIFFSTGKKLFRAPRVEKPEAPVLSEQREDFADTQRATAPGLHGKRPEFDPSSLGKPFASSLQRDFLVHKSFVAASPAMALRLNCWLPLDKLRLDQEVATYTCRPVAAAQPLQPQRSRCGNPLASFLHFQESTTFCPVGCDGSPASPRR
ncbi:hypothetical protein CRUP_034041 [Coryphaenoides rupestris]|nr:hypothetical protein CRUP_034041 [Coryphaenoides rupestris]